MNYKQIEILDFSQGIKSKEVLNNDLALQEQIERERLGIAGSGVNFGLKITQSADFSITVETGTVVDKDGKERVIDSKSFEIEKPNIILQKKRTYAVNGVIGLDDTPYSENRTETSEYAQPSVWGVEVYYEDDPSNEIYVSAIKGKSLYTDIKSNNRAVLINYHIAYDRIDTVYINDNYDLTIKPGIDSTTPSAYVPEDCKYILGFIKVVSKYIDEETNYPKAKILIIEEFNNRRTVYTDLENNLYLCGTPFESLLKIHFEEPKEPKEKMLWYDMKTNKLNVYRRTDNFMFTDTVTYTSSNPNDEQYFRTSVGYKKEQLSVYMEIRDNHNDKIWTKLNDSHLEYYTDLEKSEEGVIESEQFRIIPKLVTNTRIRYTINRYDGSHYWVPINDTSYLAVNECKMWAPNSDNTDLVEYLPGLNIEEMKTSMEGHDLKTFLFRYEDFHMRFAPGKNELSVMIDQTPLHRDQFVEITLDDVLEDEDLKWILSDFYGYNPQYLYELSYENKPIGLGFKLVNALDKPAFVEVNIQHRVNDSMVENKYKRSATFVKSETLHFYERDVDMYNGTYEVRTIVPYLIGEEQLEVFINGRKISNNRFNEIGQQLTPMSMRGREPAKGTYSMMFELSTEELSLQDGDEIIYKITSNVFSYDNISSMFNTEQGELYGAINYLEQKVNELTIKLNNLLSD